MSAAIESDLPGDVRRVVRRSQEVRAESQRLQEHSLRLHASVNGPSHCPVCGARTVSPVMRGKLASSKKEEGSALAYRCSKGHVFTPAKDANRPPPSRP